MTVITVERSVELTEAESVFDSIQQLKVGEGVRFDPPLTKPVTDKLYLLLETVDKGWTIGSGPISFWKKLTGNYPVDFGGHPIPQSIARIERRR